MDKIYNGMDLAHRDGAKNQQEWIRMMCGRLGTMLETPFTGQVSGDAVLAEINFGRWIARCPDCGGAEYVSPSEKVFYCLSCGNHSLGGDARRVVFPENREEIEAEVLSREVTQGRGINPMDRAIKAQPKVPGLSRSWTPGESVEDLKEQKRLAKEKHGL